MKRMNLDSKQSWVQSQFSYIETRRSPSFREGMESESICGACHRKLITVFTVCTLASSVDSVCCVVCSVSMYCVKQVIQLCYSIVCSVSAHGTSCVDTPHVACGRVRLSVNVILVVYRMR